MSLTVRNAVEQLYRYLRTEQKAVPFDPEDQPDLSDPLPEALVALNGALQQMAVMAPVFAARSLRSAHFRAPVTVTVAGLSNGGRTMPQPEGWQGWMAGCAVQLPGDVNVNRLLSTNGTTVTLQFPHLSGETAGSAKVTADAAALDTDVIQVLPVVRTRDGVPLFAANGRFDLARPRRMVRRDYGHWRTAIGADGGLAYYVESNLVPGAAGPRLSLMLHPAPEAELVVEFEARASLGWFTAADVFDAESPGEDPGTAIPVPGQFVESIFLPMALWRFFSSSVMRNVDVPKYVEQQVQAAETLMQGMRPQAEKNSVVRPGW